MSSQTQTQNQTQTKEKPYVIVDFLDLETEHFSFLAPKENAHGGHFIPVRYQDKALYVRYTARTTPFGISTSNEEKPEYKGKYPDGKAPNTGKKITGYSTSITCLKEYENDPYYLKAVELDEFFMQECHKNAMRWHLGGTSTKPLSFDTVEGYDDKGADGKWKRLLKWSYKKDSQGQREYLPYPPRLEFGIPTASTTEYQGPEGLLVQEAVFKTVFFDTTGAKLDPVKSLDSDTVLPKFSRIGVLSQWSSITQGTYGASLKPKAQQFRVFPSESLATDECLLNDDGEEAYDIGDEQFGGGEVVAAPVRRQAVPPPMSLKEEVDEVVDEVVDDEPMEVVDTTPAPRTRPMRTVTTSRKKP